MKKVLVTGVAGFIGSNLALNLLKKKEYKIIGIDDLSYGVVEQIPNEVEFYKEDIRNKDISNLFKNVDAVFHLAAKNCISDCQQDPHQTIDININGSINVFKAACENKVKKIIYADSSSVYEGNNNFPTSEDIVNPQSFYAISKLSASLYLKTFSQQYNINSTALRYFNVYGINQDYRRTIPPLMSSIIIKLLKKQRPIIYGDGSKERDFIHVNDVNNFHEKLLSKKKMNNFEVYNIGSGKSFSVLEILYKVKKIIKSNIQPIFKNNLPEEANKTLAENSKAKKMGWDVKVSLDNGIKEMINHIKNSVL